MTRPRVRVTRSSRGCVLVLVVTLAVAVAATPIATAAKPAPRDPLARIVANANRGWVQESGAVRLYLAHYRDTAPWLTVPVTPWVIACKSASNFRWYLLSEGVRNELALRFFVEWATMYATVIYGIPASCWHIVR